MVGGISLVLFGLFGVLVMTFDNAVCSTNNREQTSRLTYFVEATSICCTSRIKDPIFEV